MSDKKTNNSDSFEDNWKDAFENASMPPSDKVWAGIEGALGPQKFRVAPIYYRIAATLLLLLIPLGIYWFTDGFNSSTETDTNAKVIAPKNNIDEIASTPFLQKIDSTFFSLKTLKRRNFTISKRKSIAEALSPLEEAVSTSSYSLDSNSLIASVTEIECIPALYNWQFPQGEGKYQKLPYSVRKKKKEKQKPEFFVRLNASSSFYDPNFRLKQVSDYSRNYSFYDDVYSRRPEQSTMSLIPIPDVFGETLSSQTETTTLSYSAGIGFGVKLFKHWVIQGSVNYNLFRTITTSNLTVSDIEGNIQYPLTVNSYPEEISQIPAINFVGSYDILNAFEYVTIPIETGFQINGRKKSLLLKTGISTDVFIKNTISDMDNSFSSLSVSVSDSFSPYRKLSWSGNVGAELSLYQTARYAFLVEGNYRMAFNNLTNSNATFTSKPQFASVGVVFRFSPKPSF